MDARALQSWHSHYLVTLQQLDVLYESYVKHVECIDTLKQVCRTATQHSGPNHPQTAMAVHNLGRAQAQCGNFSAARKLYHAALSIYEKNNSPAIDRADVHYNLGRACLAQHQTT